MLVLNNLHFGLERTNGLRTKSGRWHIVLGIRQLRWVPLLTRAGLGVSFLPAVISDGTPDTDFQLHIFQENAQFALDAILSKNSNLKSLSVRTSASLNFEGIERCLKLEAIHTTAPIEGKLNLSNCKRLAFFSSHTGGSKVTGMKELESLKSIRISSVTDAWLNGNLPASLERLVISASSKATYKFERFERLKSLTFARQRTVDLSQASLPTSLTDLDFAGVGEIRGLEEIVTKLPGLRRLDVHMVGEESVREIRRLAKKYPLKVSFR